jgi:hypothetical protein
VINGVLAAHACDGSADDEPTAQNKTRKEPLMDFQITLHIAFVSLAYSADRRRKNETPRTFKRIHTSLNMFI